MDARNLKVGDRVEYEYAKGKKAIGTILKLNPKTAVIDPDDKARLFDMCGQEMHYCQYALIIRTIQ